ncbi:MAG: tRNA (adenosine(37)-N6)-dimethylallyltransferase MiaA [Pseudomonadota bacterium]
MKIEEDIILIAGPTASGKTGIAIEIAQANNAVIFNADSMQVYRDLRIITARPDPEEEAAASHHLFGYKDAADIFSVAQWLEDVEPLMLCVLAENRKIVFVGGTGLYFNALLNGLSPMPEVNPEVRKRWRNNQTHTEVLHQELKNKDPVAAGKLLSSDRQRIIRALEIFESTGKSIISWQEEKGVSIIPENIGLKHLLLMPERPLLHERINHRFDLMVEGGGIEEVQKLLRRNLDLSLPAMKAIGVPQISEYLEGEVSLEEAIEKAKAATRQYAKRQSTWFRNTFDDQWYILENKFR